jgi:glutamate/tyrosine decarboxylase-like PLP-dependent enzyme
MMDDMFRLMQDVRDEPAWRPIPDEVKARLTALLPDKPQDAEAIYGEFLRDVLPYRMGNIHPRFWGWVIGTGSPLGMLADMLAAGMNPNVGGAEHSASYLERQVIDWSKTMLGYPADASGVLTSGASMANLLALTVARNVMAAAAFGVDVRMQGIVGLPRRMRLYCSTETHSAIRRAVEALGLGSESIHSIPVNDHYQIDLTALEAAIAADRAAGLEPYCVVGNAGTVNTGAFDDLAALADMCAREKLWFHIDGAIGAVVAMPPTPAMRALVAGMDRADSLAFDMHKWLSMPFEVGAVLVRSASDHRATFALTPEYLKHAERGLAAGEIWLSEYSLQLSRGFRALKVWMMLKEIGVEKYGRLIAQNIEQARYLTRLVEASPALELLAPTASNIVCYRFTAPGLDESALNALNEELVMRLHEQGTAVPSTTLLKGKLAIRVCCVNHRSRHEDFDLLVQETLRLGGELAVIA